MVNQSGANLSNSTSTGKLMFDIAVVSRDANDFCTISWPSVFEVYILRADKSSGLLINLDHSKAKITKISLSAKGCPFSLNNSDNINPNTITFHGDTIPTDYRSHSFQGIAKNGCSFLFEIPYSITQGTNGPNFTFPFPMSMKDYDVYQRIYFRTGAVFGGYTDTLSHTDQIIYPPVACTVTPTNTTITLPNTQATAFSQTNPTAGATHFQFNWTSCSKYAFRVNEPLVYKVFMTWSFETDPNSNDPSHLKNTADVGLASPNIVVVVKDKGSTGGTDPNVFIKNQDKLDLGAPVSQAVNRNFTALYKATSFPAQAGQVKASATFTMTYQ